MSYKTPYPIPRSGLGKGAVVTISSSSNLVVGAATPIIYLDSAVVVNSTTESTTQIPQILSGTHKQFKINIANNTTTSVINIGLRKNGVDTGIILQIPAGATGIFYVISNIPFIVNDFLTFAIDAVPVGQMTFSAISLIEYNG